MEHLSTLLDLTGYKRFVWFSDIGPHFHSSRFLAYFLSYVPEKSNVSASTVFFPGGHGKGPVDGHFGRMTYDKKEIAKTMKLCEVEEYVRVGH